MAGHRGTKGRNLHKHPLFMDPLQILIDLFFLFFTLVYVPIRNLVRSYLQKPKSLKGKVCLVTGSGRGLGRELCIALAREGAILACADINEENNAVTVQKLGDMNAKAKAYKINVANREEVESVVKEIQGDLGPIFLLVNNAAIIMPSSNPSEEYIRATFNVNTLGAIWMTMAVLPAMKTRNEGHIVNISSICGLYGTPVLTIYAASKAALSNFSQSLRLELSFDPNNKIHVTCVHPDVINTREDYVEMLNTRLSARDVRTVTSDIMYAIKHNKTDISSPGFYYYLYALNVLFPSEVIHKFIKLLDVTMSAPSQAEWEELPVAQLVRSCRPPADSEQTMRLLASDQAKLPKPLKSRRISFTTSGDVGHKHFDQQLTTNDYPPQPAQTLDVSGEHVENDGDQPADPPVDDSSSQPLTRDSSPTPSINDSSPQPSRRLDTFTIRSLRESSDQSLTSSIRKLRVASLNSNVQNTPNGCSTTPSDDDTRILKGAVDNAKFDLVS